MTKADNDMCVPCTVRPLAHSSRLDLNVVRSNQSPARRRVTCLAAAAPCQARHEGGACMLMHAPLLTPCTPPTWALLHITRRTCRALASAALGAAGGRRLGRPGLGRRRRGGVLDGDRLHLRRNRRRSRARRRAGRRRRAAPAPAAPAAAPRPCGGRAPRAPGRAGLGALTAAAAAARRAARGGARARLRQPGLLPGPRLQPASAPASANSDSQAKRLVAWLPGAPGIALQGRKGGQGVTS